MTKPVGAGVVGTGVVARVHARSVRLAGGRLVGVAGRTPERAREAAAFGAKRPFAGTEELLADDDVDVVHVCTPNALHGPLATAALAAGKHVVCEKPLAVDPQGAERLTAAAARRGAVAAVPFVYRFQPLAREARERVAAGELVPSACCTAATSRTGCWTSATGTGGWTRRGGRLPRVRRHRLALVRPVEFVSGQRIARLVARTLTAIPERSVAGSGHAFTAARDAAAAERRAVTTEDAAVVLFETDRGAAGSVLVSQVSPGRKNRLWFEIAGERAGAAFDQEQPETLWIGRRDAPALLQGMVEIDARRLSRASRRPGVPVEPPHGYHRSTHRHARGARGRRRPLRGGPRMPPPGQHPR
jgi:predicted dehydrogenase